jgi:hypothetical protein
LAWVHDQIFAAGGSHIPATWQSFRRQQGISAVLSLSEEQPVPFLGPPAERYLWMAIADEAQADMASRRLAGEFLKDCVAAGHRVLLHSSRSRHRTRWAYVAFLLCSGKSVAAAVRAGAERPWLAPYETDRERWQQLREHLQLTEEPTT